MRRSQFLRKSLRRGSSGLLLALGIPSMMTACGQSVSVPDAASVAADSTSQPSEIKPKTVWRVAIAQGLRPFAMEKGDVLVGFDLDLIKAIGEVCNVTLKLERQPFDALAALIQAAQIDVAMGAVPITLGRSEAVEFSRPYFRSGVAIIARSENDQLTTLKALSDQTIAVTLGTSGAQLAIDVLGSTILTFDQATDALTAVKTGQADAALVALPVLLDIQATQLETYTSLQKMGELIDTYDYGIMVRSETRTEDKDSVETEQSDREDRLSAINAALKTLVKDGTYAEIYERWLGTAPLQRPF